MRPSEIDDLLAALDEVVDRRCDEAIDGLAAAIECGRIADVRAASRELDVRQGVRESLGTPPFDIPNLINVGALRTEYAHDPKRLDDLLLRLEDGVMAKAFPAVIDRPDPLEVPEEPYTASEEFGIGDKASRFKNAGAMVDGHVITSGFTEWHEGPRRVLADVLVDDALVPREFFIDPDSIARWEYLKGAKREERIDKKTGFAYTYSEGAMSFPDPTDKPSRTLLTGEGGTGPSRFKHVIRCTDGRLRRLVPDELDMLQGFPAGWTDTGMTDGQRAFCMGNALVAAIPHRIGIAMCEAYGIK